MKNFIILIVLFCVFTISCKKDKTTTPSISTLTDNRSFAIINNGKVEIYKSNLNQIETIPNIDSDISKIAIDSAFNKIAIKTDSSNIKIVDISTGLLLEEIQNTKFAKDFHFHNETNRLYYLNENDIIIAPHDSVPFMNKSLVSLTGFVSNSYINIFIVRNKIVVVDANQSYIAYHLIDENGVIDHIISYNTYQNNFVVINEYKDFGWLDVIFHDFGGFHPKLSNHYGNKTAGDYTTFTAEVRNGFKISVDDDNHKITLIDNLGFETYKQFDNYYFTGLAF